MTLAKGRSWDSSPEPWPIRPCLKQIIGFPSSKIKSILYPLSSQGLGNLQTKQSGNQDRTKIRYKEGEKAWGMGEKFAFNHIKSLFNSPKPRCLSNLIIPEPTCIQHIGFFVHLPGKFQSLSIWTRGVTSWASDALIMLLKWDPWTGCRGSVRPGSYAVAWADSQGRHPPSAMPAVMRRGFQGNPKDVEPPIPYWM